MHSYLYLIHSIHLLQVVSELKRDDPEDYGEVEKFKIGEECCGIVAQQAMGFEVIFCKNKEKNKSRDYYEK